MHQKRGDKVATTKVLDVVIQLRRDNDYNYNAVKDTFIPLDAEVCLVDTAKQGLCAIIGDGVSTYGELVKAGYVNEIFARGYLYDGIFYADEEHTTIMIGNANRIYIDLSTAGNIYYFDGANYVSISGGVVAHASETVDGVMKLYPDKGQNTDGTMTQKAITNEIGKKVSAVADEETETIRFIFN